MRVFSEFSVSTVPNKMFGPLSVILLTQIVLARGLRSSKMMMIYYKKTGINIQHKKDEAPLRIHSISLITQAFTPTAKPRENARDVQSEWRISEGSEEHAMRKTSQGHVLHQHST